MKYIIGLLVLSFLVASTALAHVTVKPSQVGVGSFQIFNISVPGERDAATIGLRLVLRDDFTFSTQVPGEEVKLAWKAYQTYSDGTTVSWELAPGAEQPKKADGSPDFSKFGPHSTTTVVDDLSSDSGLLGSSVEINTIISAAAVLISLVSLAVAFKGKRN